MRIPKFISVFTGLLILSGVSAGRCVVRMQPTFPIGEGVVQPIYDYTEIDRHALDTPKEAERSIDSLATYLIQPARNDREKARAIFRWITANVSYDTSALARGAHPAAAAAGVLRSRSAFCIGYAQLFAGLARAAGLEAVIVPGYARGAGYRVGGRYPYRSHVRRGNSRSGAAQAEVVPNHAWNAVKIDGQWQLLDCTWGAGGSLAGSALFTPQFEPFFFLTPPEAFLYTHLPSDPRWQLLASPVSTAEHERLPYLRAAFFTNGLTLDSHTQAVIRTGNRVGITFGDPKGATLIAELYQHNRKLGEPLSSSPLGNGKCRLDLSLPEAGDYVLRIFAGNARGSIYSWALDYRIEARSAG